MPAASGQTSLKRLPKLDNSEPCTMGVLVPTAEE